MLIAFFGILPEQTRSLEDILKLFRRLTFVVYFSVLGFIDIVCLAIVTVEMSFTLYAKANYSGTDPYY